MIDGLFLVALTLIWITILYGVVLTVAGSSLARRAGVRSGWPEIDGDWPGVSLLVPAHDEERVIEGSLRRYLALDYPPDRLQVVVVDDGSTDGTAEVCDRIAAEDDRVTIVHVPRGLGGRGKAPVLNRGLRACRHELIAVFDADNRPRANALRWLVAEIQDGTHVAAVGRVAKVNSTRTLLNRLSSLDFISFQWTIQAGRSRLFDIAVLPGTNYVVRADVLAELGGWDPAALTEDLELTVRLYAAGHRIAFVPEAVSEEQDPERLSVWIRQRTRWLLGNYYVLFRRTGLGLRSRKPRAVTVVWEMYALYVGFLLGLCVSEAIFLAGLMGAVDLDVGGPLLALWGLAFLVFVLTVQLASALELQDSWRTPLLAVLMYLVYAPLWLFVSIRALFLYATRKGDLQWAKTPRTQA